MYASVSEDTEVSSILYKYLADGPVGNLSLRKLKSELSAIGKETQTPVSLRLLNHLTHTTA